MFLSSRMGMIYKINLNAMLMSRKHAVSKILPQKYTSQVASDCDYAVLHQLNSTYTEIIVVRVCPDKTHNIAYVSFLHSTRIDALNEEERKIFKEMMDVVLEDSTEDMLFSIQVRNQLPEDVKAIFETFEMSVTTPHQTHNIHRIARYKVIY
jgi:hypothetical protein